MVAGFATQKVLGDAVAGVLIALTRPFRVSDRVKVAGKYEGVVVDVSVMFTVLDAGDKYMLVPSSKVVGDVIERAKR